MRQKVSIAILKDQVHLSRFSELRARQNSHGQSPSSSPPSCAQQPRHQSEASSLSSFPFLSFSFKVKSNLKKSQAKLIQGGNCSAFETFCDEKLGKRISRANFPPAMRST